MHNFLSHSSRASDVAMPNASTAAIRRVSNYLEITAAQQQIHFDVLLLFDERDCVVDFLQLSMSTSFYRHFHFVQLLFIDRSVFHCNLRFNSIFNVQWCEDQPNHQQTNKFECFQQALLMFDTSHCRQNRVQLVWSWLAIQFQLPWIWND